MLHIVVNRYKTHTELTRSGTSARLPFVERYIVFNAYMNA